MIIQFCISVFQELDPKPPGLGVPTAVRHSDSWSWLQYGFTNKQTSWPDKVDFSIVKYKLTTKFCSDYKTSNQ